MSTNTPLVISVQGGNVCENATMVSVIKDCLQERGFVNIQTDAGLPGDDRVASEHMLHTQVSHLRSSRIMIEGLTDFDFKTPEFRNESSLIDHNLLYML